MVPTFGFKISIVENVGSKIFISNWLSEVRKFLTNLIILRISHVLLHFIFWDHIAIMEALDIDKISKLLFHVTSSINQINFMFVNRVCS